MISQKTTTGDSVEQSKFAKKQRLEAQIHTAGKETGSYPCKKWALVVVVVTASNSEVTELSECSGSVLT